MTIEIVDLPIDSMVIFHSYVNVYLREAYIYNWGVDSFVDYSRERLSAGFFQ